MAHDELLEALWPKTYVQRVLQEREFERLAVGPGNERAHILATVKETKWVPSGPKGAATRLGMNRSTLQFRMKKLGILRPAM